MRRIILGALLLVGLTAFGVYHFYPEDQLEPSDEAVAGHLHNDLRAVATQDYLRDHVAQSLDADRPEDVEDYIALAALLGHTLPDDLLKRYEDATSTSATTWRMTKQGFRGFFTGDVDDAASLAGSTLADFTVYGDLRDFAAQSMAYAKGQEVDEFVLGLSVMGLGISAATVASGGTTAPLKAGFSLVKTAKRTGKLTAGMEGVLRRAVTDGLDMPGLRRRLSAVDWKSPSKAVDEVKGFAAGLDTSKLRGILGRFGAVVEKTSPSGAMRIMRHVDTAEEFAKAERITARFGKATPAVFQTLGKGAFKAFATITKLAAEALWALVTALLSAATFALTVLWPMLRRVRRAMA